MATRNLLELIHPGEILSEDFMKPMSMSKLAKQGDETAFLSFSYLESVDF
jgi:hypothetical protein